MFPLLTASWRILVHPLGKEGTSEAVPSKTTTCAIMTSPERIPLGRLRVIEVTVLLESVSAPVPTKLMPADTGVAVAVGVAMAVAVAVAVRVGVAVGVRSAGIVAVAVLVGAKVAVAVMVAVRVGVDVAVPVVVGVAAVVGVGVGVAPDPLISSIVCAVTTGLPDILTVAG